MRAVRYDRYGGPEVLAVEEVPEPHPGPGQIRIAVRAASVNPVDWKIRAGYLSEFMPTDFPAGVGRDAAGVVDEIGDGVSDVEVGDAVFGLGAPGTTAGSAVLFAWAKTPAAWTPEQAAAAGLACSAAMAALDALGDLAGKTLLIEGAAGGVGSAATQIATARGASVIGTARAENHEFLAGLGAAATTTYGPGLADRISALAPAGIDAAIDAAGSGSLAEIVEIVGDPDRVVSLADFGAAAHGVALIAGDSNAAANFAEAARLGEIGAFTPQVVGTYPLEEIADAHARIQEGHTDGKIVVVV